MNVIDISIKNPIVSHYLAQIRDESTQKDMALFRRIVYKLGIMLALSKITK